MAFYPTFIEKESLMLRKSLISRVFGMAAWIAAGTLAINATSQAASIQAKKQKGHPEQRIHQLPGVVDTVSSYNLGALVGVGILNKDLGNQIVLGVDGAYQLMPWLQVGGYFTYNSIANAPGLSASLFTIAPEITYVLTDVGAFDGLRLGAKAGIGIESFSSGTATVGGVSQPVAGSTTTSFVFGPEVAYDVGLTKLLSLGGEANYLIYTANTGFNAFNLLAALKFHL
jgi:hypothetical protein